MGFRLRINLSNGDSELVDEVFETKEDAEMEYQTWLDSWDVGRETLKLAGETYVEADIEDCEIFEE